MRQTQPSPPRQRRRQVLIALASAVAPAVWSPETSAAQASVVTVVVPFAPGGGADQLVRELLGAVRATLADTNFVVENQPGANGALASRSFARRPADANALLLGTSSTLTLNAATNKLPIGLVQDLVPVLHLAETANALAVPASSPWQSLSDFIAAGKRGELTYASFGPGSSGHLYGLLLKSETGANLVHVPYKGSAPALNDLMGGHVQSAFLTTSAVESMERDGRVRVLAVTGPQRSPNLPQVATFQQLGVSSLGFNGWFGLFAAHGTAASAFKPLIQATRQLSSNSGFVGRMTELGYLWSGEGPDRMAGEVRRSLAFYQRFAAEHSLE